MFDNQRVQSYSVLANVERPYSKFDSEASRNYTVEPIFGTQKIPREYNEFESGCDSIFLGNKNIRSSSLNQISSSDHSQSDIKNIYRGLNSGLKNKSSTSYRDKELLIQYYLEKKKSWNSNVPDKNENKQKIQISKIKLNHKKQVDLKVFKDPFQCSRNSYSQNSSRKTTKRMYDPTSQKSNRSKNTSEVVNSRTTIPLEDKSTSKASNAPYLPISKCSNRYAKRKIKRRVQDPESYS